MIGGDDNDEMLMIMLILIVSMMILMMMIRHLHSTWNTDILGALLWRMQLLPSPDHHDNINDNPDAHDEDSNDHVNIKMTMMSMTTTWSLEEQAEADFCPLPFLCGPATEHYHHHPS